MSLQKDKNWFGQILST